MNKHEAGNVDEDGDLGDLLQELRILLQGVQVLTAFLIILPFSQGFSRLDLAEKWVYVATFACSLSALVFFSAPAAQHRIERPLMDRVRFKTLATRLVIIGLVPASLALVLSAHLVMAEVIGAMEANIFAGAVAILIATMWWLLPLFRKKSKEQPPDSDK